MTEQFDFRTLLGRSDASTPAERPPCVVGVAWTGEGVGIVALSPDMALRTVLPAYNNIALGPIGSDWDTVAEWIRLLPQIFEKYRPFVLVGGAVEQSGQDLPARLAIERAFPSQTCHHWWHEIEAWTAQHPLRIASPRVPDADSWAIKPIHAAAETALFAGRVFARSGYLTAGSQGDGHD